MPSHTKKERVKNKKSAKKVALGLPNMPKKKTAKKGNGRKTRTA